MLHAPVVGAHPKRFSLIERRTGKRAVVRAFTIEGSLFQSNTEMETSNRTGF